MSKLELQIFHLAQHKDLSCALSNHCQVGPALQGHRNDASPPPCHAGSLRPRRLTRGRRRRPVRSPAAPCGVRVRDYEHGGGFSHAAVCSNPTTDPLPLIVRSRAGLGLTPPQSAALRTCSCCQWTPWCPIGSLYVHQLFRIHRRGTPRANA